MQPVFARLPGQNIGTSHSIQDRRNFHQHITGIAIGLLLIARKLRAEMADQARRKAGGQRQVRGFGRDPFLPVIADGIVADRAGRIEEHIIGSPVTSGVHAQCELVAWSEIDIELCIRRVAYLCGRILACQGGELRCRRKDQGLVCGFVIASAVWPGAGLWHDLRTAIQKLDDIRDVKNVLIESRKEKDLIALQGTADGASDLLLAVVRLEGEKWKGGAERTVAEIVKRSAV